jgi:hypothetical protein
VRRIVCVLLVLTVAGCSGDPHRADSLHTTTTAVATTSQLDATTQPQAVRVADCQNQLQMASNDLRAALTGGLNTIATTKSASSLAAELRHAVDGTTGTVTKAISTCRDELPECDTAEFDKLESQYGQSLQLLRSTANKLTREPSSPATTSSPPDVPDPVVNC